MTTIRDDLAALFLIAACIVGCFIAASALAALLAIVQQLVEADRL